MIPTDIYQLLLEALFLAMLLATFYAGVRIIEASVKRVQQKRIGYYSEIVIAVATIFNEARQKELAHGDTEEVTTNQTSGNSEQYANPSTYQQ